MDTNKQSTLAAGTKVQLGNHWSYRRGESGLVIVWTHPASKAQLAHAPFVTRTMRTWKDRYTPVLFSDGKAFFVETDKLTVASETDAL